MKRSSVFAVTLAIVCPACAPFAPSGPQGSLPIPEPAPIHLAIAAAEAQLMAAARRGDAAGLAAVLTDDAILVVASDTVRGRDAIRRFFEQLHSNTDSAAITFTPRTTDVCMDGAVEYGREVSVEHYPTRALPKSLNFRYAIRWVTYGPAEVRASALVIARPSEGWGGKFKDCVLASWVAFDRHRIAASVSLPMPANGWTTFTSLQDVMRQRGFTSTAPLASLSGSALANNTAAWWYGAGLRVRLLRPFSAEIVVGLQPKSATSAGWRPSDSTSVALTFTGAFAWAALNYEWRRLRVGAGPFLARTSWSIREQRLMSGGTFVVTAKDMWNARSSVGLLIESAYTYPLTRVVFVESQAHLRLLGKTSTRGTPAFAPAPVSLNGFGFSLGGGVAF